MVCRVLGVGIVIIIIVIIIIIIIVVTIIIMIIIIMIIIQTDLGGLGVQGYRPLVLAPSGPKHSAIAVAFVPAVGFGVLNRSDKTYSLHCNSFLGLPFRILNIELVKPKKELQWRL